MTISINANTPSNWTEDARRIFDAFLVKTKDVIDGIAAEAERLASEAVGLVDGATIDATKVATAFTVDAQHVTQALEKAGTTVTSVPAALNATWTHGARQAFDRIDARLKTAPNAVMGLAHHLAAAASSMARVEEQHVIDAAHLVAQAINAGKKDLTVTIPLPPAPGTGPASSAVGADRGQAMPNPKPAGTGG